MSASSSSRKKTASSSAASASARPSSSSKSKRDEAAGDDDNVIIIPAVRELKIEGPFDVDSTARFCARRLVYNKKLINRPSVALVKLAAFMGNDLLVFFVRMLKKSGMINDSNKTISVEIVQSIVSKMVRAADDESIENTVMNLFDVEYNFTEVTPNAKSLIHELHKFFPGARTTTSAMGYLVVCIDEIRARLFHREFNLQLVDKEYKPSISKIRQAYDDRFSLQAIEERSAEKRRLAEKHQKAKLKKRKLEAKAMAEQDRLEMEEAIKYEKQVEAEEAEMEALRAQGIDPDLTHSSRFLELEAEDGDEEDPEERPKKPKKTKVSSSKPASKRSKH